MCDARRLRPIPTLGVSDLPRAQAFYEGVLGFAAKDDVPDGVLYSAGGGSFLVYPSSFAGTNKATYMAFDVPAADFDGLVADVRGKGVEFQTFELPEVTWNDGVADFGEGSHAVWFADPDGNILNINSMNG